MPGRRWEAWQWKITNDKSPIGSKCINDVEIEKKDKRVDNAARMRLTGRYTVYVVHGSAQDARHTKQNTLHLILDSSVPSGSNI